jgi:hypothetical protein
LLDFRPARRETVECRCLYWLSTFFGRAVGESPKTVLVAHYEKYVWSIL